MIDVSFELLELRPGSVPAGAIQFTKSLEMRRFL
jgi:hypothetical protein